MKKCLKIESTSMTCVMHCVVENGSFKPLTIEAVFILFRKRETVKIAASCRRERQNEGLEGSERQQKTDP